MLQACEQLDHIHLALGHNLVTLKSVTYEMFAVDTMTINASSLDKIFF